MPQESTVQTRDSSEIVGLMLETYDQLTSILPLDELMPRIAKTVKRVIDYEMFAIFLLNEKTQKLSVRFSLGHPEDVVRTLRIGIGEGIVGRAAATARPVVVNDVRKDPEYIPSLETVRSEMAIPLISKGQVIGVLDIEAIPPGYFTERDQHFLTLLAAPMAMAIENARLYRRSVRQARNLALLGEINREISSILDPKPLLRKVKEAVRRVIDFDNFRILALDESTQTLSRWISFKRNEEIRDKLLIPVGKGIVGTAAYLKEPVLVSDVRKDLRYIEVDPEARSELSVPLIHGDRVLGVLDLESLKVGSFGKNDQEFLTNLAPGIAIAIENASLYEQVSKHEERLQRDLTRAQQIQQFILPSPFPSIPGLEVGVHFRPARELGGDLYDFIRLNQETYSLTIGDVSGKGAPAALYGAMGTGILRSLAAIQLTPGEMLKQLNQLLQQRQIEGHFLTLCFATWQPKSRLLKMANAGMPRPFLIRGETSEVFQVAGIPLGLLEVNSYEETSVQLQPGDIVCFYSDGISETLDREDEFFGSGRLEKVLFRVRHEPAAKILSEVFEVLESFTTPGAHRDDQTLMILKVL